MTFILRCFRSSTDDGHHLMPSSLLLLPQLPSGSIASTAPRARYRASPRVVAAPSPDGCVRRGHTGKRSLVAPTCLTRAYPTSLPSSRSLLALIMAAVAIVVLLGGIESRGCFSDDGICSDSDITGRWMRMVEVAAASRAIAYRAINLKALRAITAEEELPPFEARPFSGGLFTWDLFRDPIDNNDYLRGTFTYSGDFYAAIGIHSPEKMRGPIVLCYINSTDVNDTLAICLDYYGGNTDMQRAPVMTEVETAGVTDSGGVTITFRRLVRRTNMSSVPDPRNLTVDLSDAEPHVTGQQNGDLEQVINWYDFQRVIFAKGKFLDGADRPKQHDADDINAVTINFNTGVVEQLKASRHMTVIYVSISAFILLCIIGYLWQRMVPVTSAGMRWAAGIGCIATYVALCIGYTYANYLDYKEMVVAKAHVRSLGDGAAFSFVVMLLPMTRKLIFRSCFGIAVERAVFYHAVIAGLTTALIIGHGLGMLYFYGFEWCVRWRDKDRVSKLPGFIAFVLMVPVIALALLRNVSGVFWALFRASHYLSLPIVFMCCCHYPKLVYGLALPLCLTILDLLVDRFNYRFEPEVEVVAVADPRSQCTVLRVYTANRVSRLGHWYRLQIPAIGREYHPFFTAVPCYFDPDRPYLEFLIKNTADVVDQPWAALRDRQTGGGASSATNYRHQRSHVDSQKDGDGVLPLQSSAWTSRLFHHVLRGDPIESLRLRGPEGVPEVAASNLSNAIMIAGGCGIAPILATLVLMSTGYEDIGGPTYLLQSLRVLWVVPNTGLVHLYAHEMARCRCFLEWLHQGIDIQIRICITDSRGTDADSDPLSLPEDVAPFVDVQRGYRPDIAAEFTSLNKYIQENAHVIEDADGVVVETTSDRCGVYFCGPDDLRVSVRSCVDFLNSAAKDHAKTVEDEDAKARLLTTYFMYSERFWM